jgi:hypothetical protein
MRTTLDIADDILAAAKDLARRQNRTAGEVISDLARKGLTAGNVGEAVREPTASYGFEPFPANGTVVTTEMIDDLRDREGV